MSFPGFNRSQILQIVGTSFYDQTEMDTALAGKSGTGHLHDDRYYTETEVDAAFTAIESVYAAINHSHNASAINAGTLDAARLPDLSLVYAPLDHDHDSDYAALVHLHDDRYSQLGHAHDAAYAALVHLHDDRYFTESEVTALLSGKSNTGHAHAASDVTSGVFDNARINWASPSALGSTTPAAGAFTSVSGTVTDSATNTVTNVIDVVHQTSGTPTTNFGVALRFRGHSANNTLRDMGRINHRWTAATDGSRSSEAAWSIINNGTEREQIITGTATTQFLIGGSEVAKMNAAGLDVTAGTYTALYLKGNILAQALNGNSTVLGLGGGFTTTSIKNIFELFPSGNATGNALRNIAKMIAISGANSPAIGFGGEITLNLPSYNGSYYDASSGAGQLVWKYYSGDPTAATGLVSLQLRPKYGTVGFAVNQQPDSTSRVGINTEAPNNALDVVGTIQADGLRLDVSPTAETITCTHTITISVNGVNYKIPVAAA